MSRCYCIRDDQLQVLEQLSRNIQGNINENIRDHKYIVLFQQKEAEIISSILNKIKSNQQTESDGGDKPESLHCRTAESSDQPQESEHDQPGNGGGDQLEGD